VRGKPVADPILSIEPQRVSVAPGGQTALTATVYNPGDIVEGYDLDVVGEMPLPWITVTPSFVSVYPKQSATVTVMCSPPAGGVAASGSIPIGLRARSRIDPQSSAVVEADVEVGQQLGLQAKLTPVTSSGRWRGRHTLSISNWGNASANLRVTVTDPDEQLGFLVYPDVLNVPLGATATARIKVRTRKPTLRGTPRQLPFEVVAEREPAPPVTGMPSTASTPERPVLRGVFAQKPILSRGVVGLAVGSLVVALAGAGLAITLSRMKGSPSLGPTLGTKTYTTTAKGTISTVTTTFTQSGSAQATISSPPPSSTSSGGATPPLPPGSFVAVVEVYQGIHLLGESETATKQLQVLQQRQLTDVSYLTSDQYPGLQSAFLSLTPPYVVIFVGPYTVAGQAMASCQSEVEALLSGLPPTCQELQIPGSTP
jgi:hypothetical protein